MGVVSGTQHKSHNTRSIINIINSCNVYHWWIANAMSATSTNPMILILCKKQRIIITSEWLSLLHTTLFLDHNFTTFFFFWFYDDMTKREVGKSVENCFLWFSLFLAMATLHSLALSSPLSNSIQPRSYSGTYILTFSLCFGVPS